MKLPVLIDSRLRLPAGLPGALVEALKRAFTHHNPEHEKAVRLGLTWLAARTPTTLKTWAEQSVGGGTRLTLPRGGLARLREAARAAGYELQLVDRRLSVPSEPWPTPKLKPWPFQVESVDFCGRVQQGIVRSPTGSGKTCVALLAAASLGQRCLVVMRDGNLLEQWRERAVEELGLSRREVGVLRGGEKPRVGERLTLALQQTLHSKKFPLELALREFGAVLVDEVHMVGASTFVDTVDRFPAKYRLGFSADECVAAGTLICMGAGLWLPVERVRVGDYVMTPLGPRRVVHAWAHGIRRTGRVTWDGGSLRATFNTWFGGTTGWHSLETVSNVYVYPHENVQGVRGAVVESQPRGIPHEMHVPVVRCCGAVCDLWPGCFQKEEGCAHAESSRGGMVQGVDESDFAVAPIDIADEGGRGNQWEQSQFKGQEVGRREEGSISGFFGVAGTSVSVDHRSLEVARDSHRSVGVDVELDGLEVPTYDLEVEGAACYYANGALVHNTRKDRLECLVYDVFGDKLHDVPAEQLVAGGFILPVTVRMVPTDFRADWYRDAQAADKDFGRLLKEMLADEGRCAAVLALVLRLVAEAETPAFVFVSRREYAERLADRDLFRRGVRCGLMMGSAGNRQRFEEDKAKLREGVLQVAAGTYQAIGTGLDVKNVLAGVMATPLGNNQQLFRQVRGRICRASPGKKTARIYVVWDRHVFPDGVRKYKQWNDGAVEVLRDSGEWELA